MSTWQVCAHSIVILVPYKFSLQAAVEHRGSCGHCAASFNCFGNAFYCNDDRFTECNAIDACGSSTVYILLYQLIVECPWTVEGGIPLTSMVPAHLSIPLITGRRTGTETYWIGGVFPPDDLWIFLDTYLNCILIYAWFFKVSLVGCATCIICIDWWRKG